jgi:hypothetical protein
MAFITLFGDIGLTGNDFINRSRRRRSIPDSRGR